MRHQVSMRKLSRTASHRHAMLRNMVTSLLQHEQIETTVAKAKEVRRLAEKFITLGGEDTLHARRQAYSFIKSKEVVQKLFAVLGPRFKARKGGYTRVLRTRVRAGDTAPMAVIQLVTDAAA